MSSSSSSSSDNDGGLASLDDDLDSLDPSELLPTHISSSAASSSADACGAPALPPLFTHVKLVSKEGQDFLVEKEIALVSGTIRTMLTGAGQWKEVEGPIPTIQFDTISTPVLEKVIEYCQFKRQYDNTPPPLPQFKIDPENSVLLLLAAEYLDV